MMGQPDAQLDLVSVRINFSFQQERQVQSSISIPDRCRLQDSLFWRIHLEKKGTWLHRVKKLLFDDAQTSLGPLSC